MQVRMQRIGDLVQQVNQRDAVIEGIRTAVMESGNALPQRLFGN